MATTDPVNTAQVLEELGYKTMSDAQVRVYKRIVEDQAEEVGNASTIFCKAILSMPVIAFGYVLLNNYVAAHNYPKFLVRFCSNDPAYVEGLWAIAAVSAFFTVVLMLDAFPVLMKSLKSIKNGWQEKEVRPDDVPEEYRPILKEIPSGRFVKEVFCKEWTLSEKTEELLAFVDGRGRYHYLAIRDTDGYWV